MIVKIAGWFYIANAVLALLSSLAGPFGLMSGPAAVTLIYAALFGAMGYGLLKREKWGRSMAIGCSLLGWTLGGLILILTLGYVLIALKLAAIFASLFAGGVLAALAWMAFLALLIMGVGVVISFKLFWHLCSPEGCEEFGVPPGNSMPTVVASAGAWLGLSLVNIVSTGNGQFMYQLAASAATRDTQTEARRAEVLEFDREQALREREARRAAARAKTEAEIQARLEAAHAEETPVDEAPVAESEAPDQPEVTPTSQPVEEPAVSEESPPATPVDAAPTSTEEEDSKNSSHKIIKCRDSSGGVSFTQGYCPPGSKQVEMTPAQ